MQIKLIDSINNKYIPVSHLKVKVLWISPLIELIVYFWPCRPLTYNRTGLLDQPQKAWSEDGGNMRVFAHEVTC